MSRKFDYGKYDLNELVKLSPKERVELLLSNTTTDDTRFFTPLFKNDMRLISAERIETNRGKLTFEFDNTDHWANNSDNCHGGAQATIYDICSSVALAIISRPGFWMFGGVSRVLSVTYIRPATVGEVLLVECEIIHVGQRLAVIKGEMRRKRDGVLVSTCEHNKVNTDPPVNGKL